MKLTNMDERSDGTDGRLKDGHEAHAASPPSDLIMTTTGGSQFSRVEV